MTQEEFIEILEEGGYSYREESGKIVVTYWGNVRLRSSEVLPPGVVFENGEDVYLRSLEVLPPDVKFENTGDVYLDSLEELPPGVEFKNGGSVLLGSLIGGWFHNWKGRIEGINSKRLLHKMIELGLFDRR